VILAASPYSPTDESQDAGEIQKAHVGIEVIIKVIRGMSSRQADGSSRLTGD
jgi:hypothetical protein